MSLTPNDVIDGKYEIVRLLGEGGMGAVYEGLNTRIQRRVAIKVLHGNVASNQDAVQRFEREAQAAGRIGSKHIVEVLDLGDLPSGDRYMVMEYLDGEDLTARIRKCGKLRPDEVYPLAVQLLQGLAGAHAAGIIHRDLKPDNVYLIPNGASGDFVKLLDFGISKFNALGGELSMTRTGVVMGTPYYMSPEQAKGSRDLDLRTDLYAAGVIVYEALAGRVPYNAETFNELIIKIVLEEPPPLDPPEDEATAAFHAIVKKSMSRDPADRFQSAEEFESALHEWAEQLGIAVGRPTLSSSGSIGGNTRVQGTQGTQGAWAQTAVGRDSPNIPTKNNRGLMIGAGVAVLALGAIAFLALGSGGADESDTAAAAARAAEEKLDEREAALETEKKSLAEKQAAEAEKLKAAQADVEAAKARADAAAIEAKAAAPTEAKPTPKSTPKNQAARPPASKPQPAASPAPAPAPAKPASTTSTGRTIRTSF